jgi:hypothetical protein
VDWGDDKLSLHQQKLDGRIFIQSRFDSQWPWNAQRQAVSPPAHTRFHNSTFPIPLYFFSSKYDNE